VFKDNEEAAEGWPNSVLARHCIADGNWLVLYVLERLLGFVC
jgi:hypothetical protein